MARTTSHPDEHILRISPPVWLPVVVVILAGFSYLGGKIIEVRGYQPMQISVSGEGKVFAAPDTASLSFGVQTGRMPTSQLAMDTLRKNMEAILAAVKKNGIEEKDVRNESLWMNPAYDWMDGRQIPRGFEAGQSVQVKVRDLSKIGQVLSDVTAAGANQAGGVSFTIDDPEELKAEARQKAILDAKTKARALAAQLGKRIVKMKAYNESDGAGMPPMYYAKEAMMAADGMGGAGPVPVPEGEQQIRMNVMLTYEVE